MNTSSMQHAELDAQDLAIKSLTEEFLDVADTGLEFRAYLLETTLPTVVVAMEKLVREVERRNIMTDNQNQDDSSAGLENNDERQQNRPKFDPLNWLAQYLYRNNPRYSNFSDPNSSPYQKGMHEMSVQLKSRLFDLETNKRAKKRAEEWAKKQQEAHERMVKIAQDQERQKACETLLPTLFKKWVGIYWRDIKSGYLKKDEVKAATKFVTDSELAHNNPKLAEKFDIVSRIIADDRSLVVIEDSKVPASLDTPVTEAGSSRPSVVAKKETSDEKKVTKVPECINASSWNQQQFVDVFTALMKGWVTEELSEYLALLSDYVEKIGNGLVLAFSNMFFLPVWKELSANSSREKWINKLVKCVDDFDLDNAVKETLRGECFSWLNTGENDIPISQQEFEKLMKHLTGDVGIHAMESIFRVLQRHSEKVASDMEEASAEEKAIWELLGELFGKNEYLAASSFNVAFEKGINSGSLIVEQMQILMDLKFSGPLKLLNSKMLSKKEVLAHFYGVLKKTEDDVFRDMMELLTTLFLSKEEDGSEAVESTAEAENQDGDEDSLENDIEQSSPERENIEKEALQYVKTLNQFSNASISNVCQSVISHLTVALSEIHSTQPDSFGGSFNFVERAQSTLSFDEAENTNNIFLRCVAASDSGSENNVGSLVAQGLVHYEIIKEEKDVTKEDFMGVPLKDGTRCVGTLGFSIPQSLEEKEQDILFLKKVSTLLMRVVSRLDNIHKVVLLSLASKDWAEKQANFVAEAYLVNKEGADGSVELYQIEGFRSDVEDNSLSHYMLSPCKNLVKIEEEDERLEALQACVSSKATIELTYEDHKSSLFPILTENSQCVSVLSFRSLESGKGLSEDDIETANRIVAVAASGLQLIYNTGFGNVQDILDSDLQAEKYGDESKRDILFSKLMLISIRNSLQKLDNKSISEIKSYKKPPSVVFKVIKSILYILGKKPAELKTWPDVVKFVNADLLKNMIEYDPTAIQKKVNIRRCKKIMKSIKHGEAKRRGSTPTQFMFDWEIVSIELRDKAVALRKKHAQLYSISLEAKDIDDSVTDADISEDEFEVSNENLNEDSADQTQVQSQEEECLEKSEEEQTDDPQTQETSEEQKDVVEAEEQQDV